MKNRSRSGFSLLELLAVLVIMGLMVAVGVPAFLDYMRAFRLRAAANQVINDMNLARQKAITFNRDVYVFFRTDVNSNLVDPSFYPWDPDYDIVVSNQENGIVVTGETSWSLKGWPVQALGEGGSGGGNSRAYVQVTATVTVNTDTTKPFPGVDAFPDETLDNVEAKAGPGSKRGALTYDYANNPACIFHPNGSAETPGKIAVVLTDNAKGTSVDHYEIGVSSVGKVSIEAIQR